MKNVKSYAAGFALNEPGVGGVVVEVTESKNPAFPVGKKLAGYGPWKEYAVLGGPQLKSVWPVTEGLPPSLFVGILGMPGATAYFGYLELCKPKEGETLVVSGAAGAVGSIVCQIGKIKGCRVIGIAGSDDKLDYLKKIGCDAVINYKTTTDMVAAVKEAAPNGVDQYFDNVGGYIRDAVFANLNVLGRVAACGAISQYNLEKPELVPSQDFNIIAKQLTISGFIVSRWQSQWVDAFKVMGEWIKEGKLQFSEMTVEGIDNLIPAFNSMMSGENIGKVVVKL